MIVGDETSMVLVTALSGLEDPEWFLLWYCQTLGTLHDAEDRCDWAEFWVVEVLVIRYLLEIPVVLLLFIS